MPVSFVANRVTVLHTDNDGDNVADAGDVLRHTLTFTNTGDTDALNVVVNDLLGGSTETGLMNISPIAFNDAFTAIGNTALRVGGAADIGTGASSVVVGNLLSNDVGSTTVGVGALAGDDVTGFTLDTVTSGVSAQGGTFNIFADGSFNYISQAGDQGVDTFTYTIRDAGIDGVAGNADDTTSTATVTITITGQVWYVDSAASAVGADGTSAHPFTTVTALNTANVDGANDYVYVKGNATGPLVMETGEHLIGQGASLDVAGFHLADAGSRSTITNNAAGFTVTLAGGGTGNNEIAGINIVSTGGAGNHALTGTSFGNLTINNTTIDASGQGLVLSTGGIVAGSTGLVSTDSDGGANNVSLTSITGTLALGTGALSGATGTAFNVSGGSVTTTYAGNVSQASASQALVSVTGGHSGTLTFNTGTLSATNGTGLQFDNADGTYNFNGTNTLNGGDAGVDIVNGSSGNFSFSANSSITNPAGIGFNVNGGNGNIDYNGTISHNTNFRAISVQNHLGGTVSFDGTVSSTGSSDGILLATNTGAIINFTNQLTINAAGANFAASGGGTVTATGSGNTISSGTATALSVVNTNIGLAGLHFVSIASSGAVNGILLDHTGTTAGVHGGLTVTGDGGSAVNASGGVITNSTGVGISLNNARDVNLDQMTVSNGGDDGINGNTVTNFTLTNSTVTNNGNLLQEHGVQFDNLFGTGVFTNDSFTNNHTSQVTIINTSGTTDLQFSNATVSSTGTASAPDGLHGIHVEMQGTANGDLRILSSSFNNLFSNSIHTVNEGTGTYEVTVANSTFNNIGASAINIVQNNSGTVRFSVHDNPTFLRGTNNGTSSSININQAGGVPAGAVLEGRINNNVIGNNTAFDSASTGGGGINVLSVGSGTTTVQIDNNNIQGTLLGIQVSMGEDTNPAHTLNATVFSNTVLVTNINGFDGIKIAAGTLSGDVGTLRLDMHNNTSSSTAGNDFTVRPRFNAVLQMLNYAGGATDTAAVQNYLDNTRANDAAHGTWFLTPGNSGVFGNTASVPAPTLPSPLLAGVTPPPAAPADDGGTKGTGDGTGGELPPPSGDPAPAPTPGSGQPTVVDDGVLSQAELNLIVSAAIDRWAAAGATPEQIAAMRAVTFSVEDISGLSLGSSTAGHITLDSNAAGFSWFIDATPGEDSEYSGTGTRLTAAPDSQAGVRIDLLTTIAHELGHQIGLTDAYGAADRDELMYGMINPGERRLPGNDDLTGSSTMPLTGTAFALSPINIGTVPAGRTVTIQWDSTVNAFTNQIVPTFNNTSSISGSNFVTVTSNTEILSPTSAPIALDSVTLGNFVFFDANNNGTFDGADTGINGVALTLFADTNANGVFDSGIDTQIATATTAGGGLYSFANLAPGNYIVRVDAANFTGGGALVGRLTATGGSDPDDNVNNDDNGVAGAGGIVVSQAITLAQNAEPTQDATLHNDINNTLDFGFIQLNQAPTNTVPGTQTINEEATLTFTGGNAISVNDPDVGAGNLTVTLSVVNGQLTLSGTAGLAFGTGDGTDDMTMTFTGTQAAVNAALNGLLYETTANYNGADTLTIKTNDNGNTGSDPGLTGDANSEEDTDTVTINITPVNDAPTVINGTTENSTTINEDTPLAAGQSVSSLFGTHFSDALDQQQTGGNPTGSVANTFAGIAVTANGSSGATGQWQYSTNGGGSWQDIGAVTDATARLYAAGTLIRFNPATDYNGAEPTLTVHLVDSFGGVLTDNALANLSGGGATGGATRYSSGTVDLGGSISALNDAPVNTVPGTQTINEDGTVTFTGATAISVNDPDVGAGNLTVTLSMLNGQLTLSGTAGLSFSAGDGLDDTTMTFSGTQAAINAALNGLLYEATINNNGSDTLTITTNDNGNTGTDPGLTGDGSSEEDTDTVTINITPINDTPALVVATPLASTEQVFATIDAAASVHDADLDALNGGNGDYGGAVLTVVRQGGANADDLLQFAASGSFTVNGGNLEAGGLVFASFTSAGGTLTVNFNDSGTTATTALVNAVLDAIQYANNNDTPPASIDLDISLDDGAPANAGQGSTAGHPSTGTATVHVNITDTPEDAAPVVDLNGAGGGIDNNASYTENAAPTLLSPTDLAVTDADDTNIESATVTITGGFITNFDYLSVNGATNGTITGINFNYVAATGILTLTGSATLADYQAVLRQVGFESTSDTPGTSRTITWTVNDGTLDNSPLAVTTVTVTAQDDPSVAQNDDLTTDEATAINGSLFADNGHGADTDPDSTPVVLTVNGSAGNVGAQFTLPSGALLTVHADGTYDYDPNGAFDPTPTSVSGASNQPDSDSFTYELVGGSTATVTITINGIDTNDTLVGTAGPDTLDGGAGTDTMSGLGGDDIYYVDNAGDIVNEAVGAGNDRVVTSVSYTLAGGSEVETLAAQDLTATTALTLTGNEFNNTIIGNDGDNFLYGGAGNDTLSGQAGNDFLIGGTGDDAMSGDAGNDTYYVDSAADAVSEAVGGGTDRIAASASYILDAGAEVETLEAITLSATTALNLAGNDFANSVIGNDGANILSGGGAADVLLGLGGDDYLIGGTGVDSMTGGLGNDTYYVDDSADVVNELVGEGTDRVAATVSYVLDTSSEVEVLEATNSGSTNAMDLTGNDFVNVITGNDGANFLRGNGGADVLVGGGGDDFLIGGSGNDTMSGNAGNDNFYVDATGDIVYEAAGEGNDRVATSVSFTLSGGVEVEHLEAVNSSDTSAINLTGNEFGNFIVGNNGVNVLNGGSGNDDLVGLGGADVFQFTTALGANNVDVIGDFVHGTDKIALDDAIFDQLVPGALAAGTFHVGTSATDEDQRIIYDSVTGNLYYDADGLGAQAAVLFATMQNHPTLTASDFVVI